MYCFLKYNGMRTIRKPQFNLKICALTLSSILSTACDNETQRTDSTIPIPSGSSGIMLKLTSPADGRTIPVYFTIPVEKDNPVPAIVVLHGSGGLWSDQDSNGDGVGDICNVGILTKQFREWETLLRDQGYAVAFPDSYSPRNTCENEGDYKIPPLKFQISGTFIRNRDALATLELLKQLVWEHSGQPIIDSNKVALLGFSDGATAVLSTVYNPAATPPNWTWKQSFDGVSYTNEVLPPPVKTELAFTTAVAYYPGSYHNGYYGNICSATGIYQSYCDILFHLPDDDPLTLNSECLIATMNHRGGGVAIAERYPNTKHSFDSNNEPENTNARNRTLKFLREKLGFN